jgi:c-di-GMP phosphodiesterase
MLSMITGLIDDEFAVLHLINKSFLGRQAILNRDQKIVGYKLLVHRMVFDMVAVTEDFESESATTIHNTDLDLDKLFGGLPGFVSVDVAVVMSNAVHFFNNKNLVLEISESDASAPGIAERIAELESTGFIFALRDVKSSSQDLQKVLPFIAIIKINISEFEESQLLRLCSFYKQTNKKLVAENIQTIEQFEMCLKLGFDNFQGYFFAKFPASSGSKISPSELSIIHLMKLINSEAENGDIESQIKHDVTIGLNLLRLVNTPAAGVLHRIESIRQALLILGRRQLQRWLQILLYTKSGSTGNTAALSPLLVLAGTRGKLLELVAEKLKPGNHGMADMGFTIGIMSLMDSLFHLSMGELLKQISVVDEVSDALLYRKGFFGEILSLVEYVEQFEKGNSQVILPILDKLRLTAENFNRLQLIAFDWADQIAREAC